jgi:hypothetical protein
MPLLTKDFRFGYWSDLDDELGQRFTRLERDTKKLGNELGRANAFQLAAADLFVEKAQVHLTQRADRYNVAGGVFAITSLAIIGFMIYLAAFYADITKHLTEDSWKLVILIVLKAAALAGFAAAAIYFCASLSRAFFHEATTLYNRRHALRFGRMFVYLRFGASKADQAEVTKILRDLSEPKAAAQTTAAPPTPTTGAAPELPASAITPAFVQSLLAFLDRDVRADDLEKAFGWNLETYTGFRDIKPEQMSTNIYSRTIDMMGKVVESLAKMKTGTKD